MKRVWLLADVHLTAAPSAVNDGFLEFLRGVDAARVSSLYILGDLFDVWVGDDDGGAVGDAVADALAGLGGRGVAVFFQHGNRDFMLGMRYALRCGMTLLPEAHVLEAGGERYLLAHGDALVADAAYLRFRRRLRHPLTLALAAALPRRVRRWVGGKLRAESRGGVERAVMDDAGAAALLRRHGCRDLLHGHLHQSGEYCWTDGGGQFRRWCLPSWENGGGYAEVAGQGAPRLVMLPPLRESSAAGRAG